jgi:sulfide dehydrogenase cytochrome subunit
MLFLQTVVLTQFYLYKVVLMRIQLIKPVLIILFCSTPLQATEITRGVMLSNSCAACHGTDGKSPGAIPSIYRKPAEFISQALLDFREGRRPATVMGRHASGYSDEEIQMIADYFSSLP